MNKNAHTPGPWQAIPCQCPSPNCKSLMVKPVVMTQGAIWNPANAHLIAAAPELLEALEWLLNAPGEERGAQTAITFARAAIAKARGLR